MPERPILTRSIESRLYQRLLTREKALSKQVEYWKQKVAERSWSFPKGHKWYLPNKLFGLSPSEIAEMEGLDKKSSSVHQLIILAQEWIKLTGRRNEALDCTVYSYAAALRAGIKMADWSEIKANSLPKKIVPKKQEETHPAESRVKYKRPDWLNR